MAFCVNCGAQNADGARFCTGCGKAVAGAASPQAEPKPRTVTVGQVKKCPSCGSPIESFQGRCSSCGHELQAGEVVNSAKELAERLQNVGSDSYRARAEIIRNFPIPNAREDLLEFAIYAFSQWEGSGDYARKEALKTKMKEVELKAKIVFSDDPKSLSQITDLVKQMGEAVKTAKLKDLWESYNIFIIIGAGLLVFFLFSGIFLGADSRRGHRPLEALYTEIRQHITDGDFTEARIRANNLIWTHDRQATPRNYWDGRRERLLEEIEMREATQ